MEWGTKVTFDHVAVSGCATGLRAWSVSSEAVAVELDATNGTTVSGGATGMFADGATAIVSAQNCTVGTGTGTGVLAQNGGTLTITGSDLAVNSTFGADNLNTSGLPVLTATCDWWGDASGPAPTGSGSVVSGNVIYTPWSITGTQPYNCAGCDTPVGLTVEDADGCVQSGVNISWSPVTGATGYDLRVDGGTPILSVTSPISTRRATAAATPTRCAPRAPHAPEGGPRAWRGRTPTTRPGCDGAGGGGCGPVRFDGGGGHVDDRKRDDV